MDGITLYRDPNTKRLKLQVTDSVYLDEFNIDDIEALVSAMNNEEVTRYLSGPPSVPYTKQDAFNFLELASISVYKDTPCLLAIRQGDGQLIGSCAIRVGVDAEHVPTTDDICSFGFWLLPEVRGQGIMPKVMAVAMKMAREEFGCETLQASCMKHNSASKKCLEKCGFKVFSEGTYKKQATGELFPIYNLKC